jgi:hypothetical protein
VLYNLSLQTSNIAAMIISAKVVDKFLFRISGRNYAIDYQHWHVVYYSGISDVPWCHGSDDNCGGESWLS